MSEPLRPAADPLPAADPRPAADPPPAGNPRLAAGPRPAGRPGERPLHVELVLGSTAVGGTERQVLRLARELRNRGTTVSIVVLDGTGPLIDDLHALGVPVGIIGFGGISPSRIPGIPTANSLRGLWRLVRHRRLAGPPDVSHAFLDGAVAVAPRIGALRSRRNRPRRHVAGVRGNRQGTPGTRRRFITAIRHADAVVCNAPHLATEMIDLGADPARVRVIANGVDLPATVADVGVAPPVAVVVANFHAYKGHGDLLHALAQLPQSTPLTVRLCGTGDERHAMQALAAELGVGERVVFVDPPADVPAELAGAQLAIHPSHTEGLSNAILEQLAAGLPVVACRVGGSPVLVADEVNGLLVPPADPSALAAAIASLATDADQRARMAVEARATAQRFSWWACTQAHLDVYRAVADDRPLTRGAR